MGSYRFQPADDMQAPLAVFVDGTNQLDVLDLVDIDQIVELTVHVL